MLTEIKNAIKLHEEGNVVLDAILEGALSVKDAFLDDPETDIDGAEDDPAIKKLIDSIPEYDSADDGTELEQDIEALSEGLVETVLENASDIEGRITHLKDMVQEIEKEISPLEQRLGKYHARGKSSRIDENIMDDLKERIKAKQAVIDKMNKEIEGLSHHVSATS